MFDFTFELINGLKVGIEHITDEEGDWVVIIDFLIFRVGIIGYANVE